MVKVVKIAGLRKAVAERLGYSWRNCLPVALMTDFDASSLLKSYREGKERFGENSPSITAFVVKVVGEVLEKRSEFNANIEGDEVKILDEVNIAVAVDTPKGLYAPTIKNVNSKTLLEVEAELRTLVDKAMKGTITLNELAGHGFTVSNLGHLGITYFTPIINPPDICILGFGAVKQTTEGHRGHLTLVFDHRAVDGAPAAAFLGEIRRRLEEVSPP
ncbi:MAG: 2-oxo acid dehydrogenase subunit E2 [Candidatus Caldarchaeum sp.]|nr:2-oxo acid dehydrogenase subunit E2 [Candidatus Caldarchaeum sp.]MDW8063490.1 2-oxo acid dehydrogenase subunit E2 [Candidatus Caldarchaeum sp.]